MAPTSPARRWVLIDPTTEFVNTVLALAQDPGAATSHFFVTAASEVHFGRGAERLFMSRPTLSKYAKLRAAERFDGGGYLVRVPSPRQTMPTTYSASGAQSAR
jgi:hypothetical protein